MKKEEIFKVVQDYTSDPPLILAGTGLTIPVGIPGMHELARYLRTELDEKYRTNLIWTSISEKIKQGMNLEKALSENQLDDNLLDDIKRCTWTLVNDADIKYFKEKPVAGYRSPFLSILDKFLRVSGRHLDIITTNYDRYIEYCCDQCGVEVDIGYRGIYLKSSEMEFSKKKNNVTLLKVHGSLDSFINKLTNVSVSLPLQENIPNGYIPEIITPGANKYQNILANDNRKLLYHADTIVNSASAFLCIGYGFNDPQIQELIIKK